MAVVDVHKRKLFFNVGHLSLVIVGKNNATTRILLKLQFNTSLIHFQGSSKSFQLLPQLEDKLFS